MKNAFLAARLACAAAIAAPLAVATPAFAEQPSYAEDRAEIEELTARYLFALDWNDFDTFVQTFTEDGEFEFARGTAHGRDEIRETISNFKQVIGKLYQNEDGSPATLRHIVGQSSIRVEGDKAWTRTFWWEMASNGPGDTPQVGTFGIYEDELVRVDGEWKFKKKRVLNDFLPNRKPGETNPVKEMDQFVDDFIENE